MGHFSFLVVEDNGRGIEKEEFLKIQNMTSNSLYYISQIAHVLITSKSISSQWSFSLDLNTKVLQQNFSDPKEEMGTVVKISNLFYNFPVRNRNKNEQVEIEKTIKLVENWFSLLYHQIAISLYHNNNKIFICDVSNKFDELNNN